MGGIAPVTGWPAHPPPRPWPSTLAASLRSKLCMFLWSSLVFRGGGIRPTVQRGRLARKLYAKLRRERAEAILRKFVLRNVQRNRYRAWLAAIVVAQTGACTAIMLASALGSRRMGLTSGRRCGDASRPP